MAEILSSDAKNYISISLILWACFFNIHLIGIFFLRHFDSLVNLSFWTFSRSIKTTVCLSDHQVAFQLAANCQPSLTLESPGRRLLLLFVHTCQLFGLAFWHLIQGAKSLVKCQCVISTWSIPVYCEWYSVSLRSLRHIHYLMSLTFCKWRQR